MEEALKTEATPKINSEEIEQKFRAAEAHIKANLNEQASKIQEKLEERKKNSFLRSRSSAPNSILLSSPLGILGKPTTAEQLISGIKKPQPLSTANILAELDPFNEAAQSLKENQRPQAVPKPHN